MTYIRPTTLNSWAGTLGADCVSWRMCRSAGKPTVVSQDTLNTESRESRIGNSIHVAPTFALPSQNTNLGSHLWLAGWLSGQWLFARQTNSGLGSLEVGVECEQEAAMDSAQATEARTTRKTSARLLQGCGRECMVLMR